MNSVPALTLTEARMVTWTQPALKELATRLPPDDQALEGLIEEAVRQRDEAAFRRLIFAAIGTERRIDARLLSQGSPLFLDVGEMAIAALNCSGDVGRALLEARDDLGLSPDEPLENIYYDILSQSDENHWEDSEELTQARRALDLKSEEVRKLKTELITLHEGVKKLEQRPVPTIPAASTTPGRDQIPTAPNDPALSALRAKLRSLRDLLKERHSERNELRRELEQAREQLEALHVESPTPAAPEESVGREPLLLETEDLGHQPVRLPANSKRFVEHFSNLPRPVARSAMMLVGRLAAGDSSAFAGVKRLRALPEVYRQRVAGDYRLLFRLRPDALELVDLVNRKDLERTIKSLA